MTAFERKAETTDFVSPASFWLPDAVVESAWHEHAPFAFWLMDVHRPRVFVELGSHHGFSYLGFCQAAERLGLETKGYAIDTWQGDEHAGFYGNEVYERLRDYHEPRYGHFSRLVRSTFDEALKHFSDGSIDLLHIDGRHFYDDVKHDFETWKNKLSDRAVVLFHDTNVRERGFGVSRLWEELCGNYPGFAFLHCHGLGMLGYGTHLPLVLNAFFAAMQDQEIAREVRRAYARLGGAISAGVEAQRAEAQLDELRTKMENELASQRDEVEHTAKELAATRTFLTVKEEALSQALAEATVQAASAATATAEAARIEAQSRGTALETALGEAEECARNLRQMLDERTDQLNESQDRIAALDTTLRDAQQRAVEFGATLERTTAELAAARDRGAELATSLAERQRELAHYTQRIVEMKTSLSWRLTEPFREMHNPIRRLRASRLGVKLVAAWRHPSNSDKRKRYRANYMPRRLPPGPPRARPTKFATKLQAIARHPFSSKQRKAYRELSRNTAPSPASLPLKAGQESTISPKERYRASCVTKLTDFLRSNARITLKTSANPEISIIIVLYNGAELTFEHLCSLCDALHVPCEVIFIDNASTDRTHELLSRVDGARTIFNQNNLHFLRAVNQGARAAKGNYVLLLNNDTRINADSISIANQILNEDSGVGAVGGKIILLDGTLQEAGSMVWRDGSCSGYGRGRNPSDADFEFRRDVDYCSGAFLMVRKSLFTSLGGFDERFAPAYYEETDFCMKLWANGHRIVYDPAIEVTHFEFGSSSCSDEAIALQARNHKIFCEIHREMLERHHSVGTSEIRARARSNRRRILVIDDQVPFPQLGAGFPRAADMIKSIHRAGWLVTFYPLRQPRVDFNAVRAVFPPEMEVVANGGVHALREFLRERAWLFDAVLVSRPHNMVDFRQVYDEIPGLRDSLPVIYDAEALFTEREALRCKLYGMAWDEAQYREELSREIALATRAKAVIAVSDREAQLISRRVSNKVYVVGHKRTPTPSATPWEDRKNILFVGSLSGSRQNSPNIDGLCWFVEEIMPILNARIGTGYRLVVAGRYESAEVLALSSDRVAILGMVDDLADLYAESRIFIAPTRFAAGIPYKVHEASAVGIPIVATSLIATQAERTHEKDILVGDDAQAFADCCARLYRDKALWEQVRAGAIASVTCECSPDQFDTTVTTILADIPVMLG